MVKASNDFYKNEVKNASQLADNHCGIAQPECCSKIFFDSADAWYRELGIQKNKKNNYGVLCGPHPGEGSPGGAPFWCVAIC